MKYITILGDGWSDYPNEKGETPLSLAYKPNIDKLAAQSFCGLCKVTPDNMKPASDVANMTVMGFDPKIYYTGRSPLEAASIGIDLAPEDVSYRCNLVTLSGEGELASLTMDDYSAGEIDAETARKLIGEINEKYAFPRGTELFAGISYRHCLVLRGGKTGAKLTPPHDITFRPIAGFLPGGENKKLITDFMIAARKILAESETNKARIAAGKKPANSVWLWGEGTRPSFKPFRELYSLDAAVISAVDLVKGIGIVAGMDSIDVEGATGTLSSNFDGKTAAAIDALKTHDYLYIHLEAPDECGHQGDWEGKIRAIELIDKKVVRPVFAHLSESGEPFRLLITPDHPTPVCKRTHVSDPVPFIIYDSCARESGIEKYDERHCAQTGNFLQGTGLFQKLISQ